MAGALAGIRILDFTRYQQGPYATVMLGDMGADIWKVEDPLGGDYGRRMWREPDGYSGFWEALNRGKKSVALDLREPSGREVALELGAACDVVVENFRPGTMDEWGLGHEAFRERNPRIVYAQATGWGTRGPLARFPSFDQIAQAYSGFAQHSGGGPGERPEVPYPGVADQAGAMNLAFAIVTALFARERTGEGQKVEVSLLGSQLALQAPELQHALHFGRERPREFRAAPTVGHYECSDGVWVMVVVIDQKFWPRMLRALGIEELENDPRFARGWGRWTHRADLEPLIERAFRRAHSGYWVRRLRAEDVPCAVVQDYEAVAQDEQVAANSYIVRQEHPRFGDGQVVGLHVQLQGTPGEVGAPAPELGADTENVLRAAGLSGERIAELRKWGALGTILD